MENEEIVKTEGGELTVFDPTANFSPDENFEGVTPRLPKISILHTAQMFEVEEEKVDEFVGVVVDTNLVNAFWEKSFSETGGGSIPDCSSMDGERPERGENIQSQTCASCPKNAFGSDGKGGKACKNMRRLHILLPGDFLPTRLTMTSSSFRSWGDYMTELSKKQLKYFYARTKFSLEKAFNKGGIEFSKLKFELVEPISTKAEDDIIQGMRKQMNVQMRKEDIQGEEYIPKEKSESDPF